MGASRKHRIFSMEGIVAALKPNRSYQVSNLATAYGVKSFQIRPFLEQAVKEGLLDKVRAHGEICYKLVWSDEPVTEVVRAPYRNLHLGEQLTGYDSSLFAFANLCMMSRK